MMLFGTITYQVRRQQGAVSSPISTTTDHTWILFFDTSKTPRFFAFSWLFRQMF